ncbi:hypothetical protein E4U30_004103 [Claviceps sp. LM220 group G6]|nr:hypothetical protein E4U15_005809 [Claviceps sp. LM218 group G6]KAG6093661.1 hypothetical protein E4U30_004103 [Claviceps sp. LM220 group G6]KAG6112114.1 hypothetical protein E4U31_003569 [Claviceps sp. LM219 group G6]KAG6120059.1 hypothetical protein E4U14_004233 [Claviceps sp. LM454 group G7]
MCALLRSRIPLENVLCRAFDHKMNSCGGLPAYKRLASQLSQASRLSSARGPSHTLATGSILSPLRCQLPLPLSQPDCAPAEIAQKRQLHTSRLWQKDDESGKGATESSSAAKNGTKNPEAENETDRQESQKSDEKESSGKSQEEDGKKHGKSKKEDMPPPPPHGDKTPWQVFMETMNTEFQASKEWNESTKQIGAAANQFTESESVRRAREAYEKSTGAISSTTSRAVKTTAGAIGKGAAWTWETPVMKGVRKAANVTGDAVDKATKPIRETEAYRNVKDVIDDGSSSRYGGWLEKEERRKRRALMEQQNPTQTQSMEEDPNAGTNVTLHKDAAWKEAWKDFRDSNKFVQGLFSMKGKYEESENPLVSTARSITDRIGGFFAENETAMVIKKFRTMDPAFQVEPFLQELREYILPEVLDAYVKGDTETLQLWLSAAQYSVYEALTKQYLQAGMKSDGRILDIRNVDIMKAKLLDPGEIPIFIITCRTQEVHVYRNAKTNELAAGMEDRVQLVSYAIGMTRVPEDAQNPETRGWRLIEMQKSGREWY